MTHLGPLITIYQKVSQLFALPATISNILQIFSLPTVNNLLLRVSISIVNIDILKCDMEIECCDYYYFDYIVYICIEN